MFVKGYQIATIFFAAYIFSSGQEQSVREINPVFREIPPSFREIVPPFREIPGFKGYYLIYLIRYGDHILVNLQYFLNLSYKKQILTLSP